jgi:hypothetical protein
MGDWENNNFQRGYREAGNLKRTLGHATGYFQPRDMEGRGTAVVVDTAGNLLSVEECALDEFERLENVKAVSSRFAFFKLPFRWLRGIVRRS